MDIEINKEFIEALKDEEIAKEFLFDFLILKDLVDTARKVVEAGSWEPISAATFYIDELEAVLDRYDNGH